METGTALYNNLSRAQVCCAQPQEALKCAKECFILSTSAHEMEILCRYTRTFTWTPGETLNTPLELCPALVFLVFLHMFFGRAWFCIKRMTCFFNSAKD
jgi:hypothetical protein